MTAPKTTVERVKAIRESLPKSYEFDERDLALLDLAEQQARDIDALVRTSAPVESETTATSSTRRSESP